MENFVSLLVTVFCLTIYTSSCAADAQDSNTYVTEYKNINDGSGNYEFSYTTSNGQERSERGQVVNPGRPDQYIAVDGMFCIKDQATRAKTCVFYKADLNGYRIYKMTTIGDYGLPVDGHLLATILG